jgi:YbbR domain-containing protein
MFVRLLRWLGKNVGTLLLAFLLAMAVWISAVLSADPNVERPLARTVPIEFMGKDPGLKIMGNVPSEVQLTFVAPQSVWDQLDNQADSISVWVDLSNLSPGEYELPVQVQIHLGLARLVKQDPEVVQIELESLVSQSLPVSLMISGEPPLGYKADEPQLDPSTVTISGPVSLVEKVVETRAQLNIDGAIQTITQTVTIVPLDQDGRVVTGVTLLPTMVKVNQPVNLLGGYRNVIVKVVTTGNVASGYRLTNYFVSPSSVIVFSSDPKLVNALPGYVETQPLDLTGADDDFEALLELDLPTGVSVVTDAKVLVQVSIAAIESSMTVSLPVEITGLAPGLEGQIAPATVDIIIAGPVPVLNKLKPTDIRVKVDLSDYGIGVHQVIPEVDFLPERIQKVSILPATVEVTIVNAPTSTSPSSTPPVPSLTPVPTRKP